MRINENELGVIVTAAAEHEKWSYGLEIKYIDVKRLWNVKTIQIR